MRRQIDKIIIISAIIMCVWGVLAVFSTTVNSPAFSNIYIKQLFAALIGLGLMMLMRILPYRVLEDLSFFIFLFSISLLVAVLLIGTEIHGGKRWLNLFFFYFQPVEFAKVALIFSTARLIRKRSNFFISLLPLVIVFFLVTAQPDYGSMIPMFFAVFAMLSISDIETGWVNILVFLLLIFGGTLLTESYLFARGTTLLKIHYIIWPILLTGLAAWVYRGVRQLNKNLRWKGFIHTAIFIWGSAGAGLGGTYLLKDYQRRRIVAFLMPELDPLGVGYNTRQSLLALGSGRLTGRGLFGGTQTQLGFLPVRHTDFIFASIAEELGFIGSFIMLALIFTFLWQFIKIIEQTEEYSAKLIATGLFTVFISQTAMNIAVTLGMLPVMGLQLPLISYGGTGLIAFLGMTGIMLNINLRGDIIAS
ncbi:MAG: FtsW/RodA/SpoVE family cell cycle protein [Elusimicrobia bacterium]|nr:FtsW/RodA/SpoVE family cell cycle protein [Elusimicrobiota bacterium]